MTIPNLITTLRIILTPIFIIYLLDGQFGIALVIFCICALSDGLDGFLARLLKQKSALGAFLDPMADKLILISTYVALAVMGEIPVWLSVIVLSRDVLIALGVATLQIYRMEFRIMPSIVSKITTCCQFLTVVWVLASTFTPLPIILSELLYHLTAAATIISGLHYMRAWFRMMNQEGQIS